MFSLSSVILSATLLSNVVLSVPTALFMNINNCQEYDTKNPNYCLTCNPNYYKLFRTDVKRDWCVYSASPDPGYMITFFSPADNSTLMCVLQDPNNGNLISAKKCDDLCANDSPVYVSAGNFGVMADSLYGSSGQVAHVSGATGDFTNVCEPTDVHGLACSPDFKARSSCKSSVTYFNTNSTSTSGSGYGTSPSNATLLTLSDASSGTLALVPFTPGTAIPNLITNMEVDHVQPKESTPTTFPIAI